jgi:ribA/ribD-fused uncharacterized protein
MFCATFPLGRRWTVDRIEFYRASGPYGCFSKLYRRVMHFEGEPYYCAEAAYQAGKARKREVRAWLLGAPTPSILAMAAHGLNYWDIAPGWSKGRYDRMRRVVEAKFRQHPDLAAILLSTGDAEIVECGTVDNEVNRRWGQVNGVGQNWLGRILMEVREILHLESATDHVLQLLEQPRGAAPEQDRAEDDEDQEPPGHELSPCELAAEERRGFG